MSAHAHDDMSREELLGELRRVSETLERQSRLTEQASEQEKRLRAQQEAMTQALEAERDRYAELFDFAPVAYVVLDNYGVIRAINLSAARLFGTERHHLVGRLLLGRVAAEDRRIFLEHLRQCRTVHGNVTTDVALERLDGTVLAAQLVTKRGPIGDDGDEVHLTTIMDLTERLQQEDERLMVARQQEEARAENRAKDRFIAVLSHELRNPLTPVLLTVQTIERGLVHPERLPAAMAVIRRNVEQEVRLIDDLLDVTRIANGKVRLQREPLDLHDIVQDVVSGRLGEVERAALTAALDLRAARRIVVGDAVRLRQVVWNLLNNAMRYTPSGGHITIRTENPSADVVRMYVDDTGQGIAPDMLERIFLPFDQAMLGHNQRGGLGLGLTICKGLVEFHGGCIAARSEGVGRGASFTVDLPATGASQSAAPVESRATPRPAERRLRIMVLEDNLDSADAIATILRLRGHDVAVVHRVREALDRTREPFDVLVSDLSLPDGSGLEAMRAFTSAGSVHGVAVSGFGTAEDVRLCREAGFAHHLTKPVELDSLVDLVEAVTV